MPSPAKRSSVPSYLADQGAHRRMVFAQHGLHLLGLGRIGERREAAQVDEHVADLAPMRREDRFLARRRGSHRTTAGAKKRFSADMRSSSVTCCADALFELGVPFLQRRRLPAHFVLQRLDAQQRAHAREELRLVDGLAEEVVGARLDALDPLLLRVERSDEHHRQQRGLRIGAQPPAHVVAGQARHHDVEQDQVGGFARRSSPAPPRRWSPSRRRNP